MTNDKQEREIRKYEDSPPSPQNTLQKQIDTILSLILLGKNTAQIRNDKDVLAWEMDKDTINKIINEADRYLFEVVRKDAKKELGKAYMQLDDLYGKCLEGEDYRVALECIKTKMSYFDTTGGKGVGAGTIIGKQENTQNNFQINLEGLSKEEKQAVLKTFRRKAAGIIVE